MLDSIESLDFCLGCTHGTSAFAMAGYLWLVVPSKHSLIGELSLQELVITAEHQKKNCKWCALLASWELLSPNLLGLSTPIGILVLLCLPNQTCQTHTFWLFLHFILTIPWVTLVVYHYSKKQNMNYKYTLRVHSPLNPLLSLMCVDPLRDLSNIPGQPGPNPESCAWALFEVI